MPGHDLLDHGLDCARIAHRLQSLLLDDRARVLARLAYDLEDLRRDASEPFALRMRDLRLHPVRRNVR